MLKPATKLAQIPRPADTILFWDSGKSNWAIEMQGWNDMPGSESWWNGRDPIDKIRCPHCYPDWKPRHHGGRNDVSCDGHAKWARDSQMNIYYHYDKWDWRVQG